MRGLTAAGGWLTTVRMLQHNSSEAAADGAAHGHARRAHIAHAAVVAIHALCCGAPIVLLLVASAATSAAGGFVTQTHAFLHGHELWLIALSAALILGGAWAEWRARQSGHKRFPVLFALSLACLLANVAIVAVHRI